VGREAFESGGADAADGVEVGGGEEGRPGGLRGGVLLAVGNDAPGEGGTDAGEDGEFVGGGSVGVERALKLGGEGAGGLFVEEGPAAAETPEGEGAEQEQQYGGDSALPAREEPVAGV
jgi:hypothetical protein